MVLLLVVLIIYVDVWEFWLCYLELVGLVDYVIVYVLLYWEDDLVLFGCVV